MSTSGYVIMLRESLEKKVRILDAIIAENERQRDILQDANAQPEDLDDSIDRKSDLAEELDKLDEGFTEVFDRVKLEVEKNRASYADEIKRMQTLIRTIMDRSARINTQESRNSQLARDKFSYIREQVQKITKSQQAVNSYYKNMMKVNYVDPQFMDNKK